MSSSAWFHMAISSIRCTTEGYLSWRPGVWRKVLVTSSSKTSSLASSTSNPSKMRLFVPFKSVRAVAMTGSFVLWSRRRVSSNPMPREAGVVRIQDMVVAIENEDRRIDVTWRGPCSRGNCQETPCCAAERSYGICGVLK